MKTRKFGLTVLLIASAMALGGCSYDSKHFPMYSWFDHPVEIMQPADLSQDKKADPLPIALYVKYEWEGANIDKERADWHEQHGIWLATKRYLEETKLFKVVNENDNEKEPPENTAIFKVTITKRLSDITRQELKKLEEEGKDEEVIYRYDLTVSAQLKNTDGKEQQGSREETMLIGTKKLLDDYPNPQAQEKFVFSYFNNGSFHTEFVRRFYQQMLLEIVSQLKLPTVQ